MCDNLLLARGLYRRDTPPPDGAASHRTRPSSRDHRNNSPARRTSRLPVTRSLRPLPAVAVSRAARVPYRRLTTRFRKAEGTKNGGTAASNSKGGHAAAQARLLVTCCKCCGRFPPLPFPGRAPLHLPRASLFPLPPPGFKSVAGPIRPRFITAGGPAQRGKGAGGTSHARVARQHGRPLLAACLLCRAQRRGPSALAAPSGEPRSRVGPPTHGLGGRACGRVIARRNGSSVPVIENPDFWNNVYSGSRWVVPESTSWPPRRSARCLRATFVSVASARACRGLPRPAGRGKPANRCTARRGGTPVCGLLHVFLPAKLQMRASGLYLRRVLLPGLFHGFKAFVHVGNLAVTYAVV